MFSRKESIEYTFSGIKGEKKDWGEGEGEGEKIIHLEKDLGKM